MLELREGHSPQVRGVPNALAEGKDAGEVLDDLGFNLYCCRRMFVGHIDLIDEVAPFSIDRQQ